MTADSNSDQYQILVLHLVNNDNIILGVRLGTTRCITEMKFAITGIFSFKIVITKFCR